MAGNRTYRSSDARVGIHAARAAREELGLPLEEPLDDVLLAVEQVGPPVAVLDLDEGIAGAYLCRPAGRLILVNRVHAVQRQRFTLAHEFGHHRMDHETNLDHPKDMTGYAGHPAEVQANWFASEFLMPMPAARRWTDERIEGLATLEDVVRFAAAFGVSAKAACIRLQNAACIPDEQRCRQLHQEIDDCLHYPLPDQLDLTFPDDGLARIKEDGPRQPPAIAGNPMHRYARGELDARTLAATLGRSPDEVRAAALEAGLPPGA